MTPKFSVGTTPIYLDGGAVLYAAGLSLDWDGAPGAYSPPTAAHPNSGRPPGLDDLRNAGGPGNWYGVVTDTGKPNGNPVVQAPGDPAPGFYVSATALGDGTRTERDQRRYVDAMTVPYISIPGGNFRAQTGVALGDLCVVLHVPTGAAAPTLDKPGVLYEAAIIADIGPRAKIGEGSPALARALHLPNGRDQHDVLYCLLPGTASKPAWPRAADEFHAAALAAFAAWGGTSVEDGVARVRMVLS